MKNKRQEAKYQTYNNVIAATKEVILEKGIIQLRTIDVAKKAKIAHGTLFSHFATKDLLIAEICQLELTRIAIQLKEITLNRTIDISTLLEKYLSLVAENENFYVIIAKEFPFLSENIQESIIANEIIVRNILYQKIEAGNYQLTDITMIISYLFATINYYLSRKEFFINGSTTLMEQKKQQIIDTFLKLLITKN